MRTSFLRPMPGAARLYPETDVLPVKITKELYTGLEKVELIEDKIDELVKKYNTNKELTKALLKEQKTQVMETILKKHKSMKPAFVIDMLLSSAKQVKKQFNVDINPSDDDFQLLFDYLAKGKIAKESMLEILKESKPVKSIIATFELMSDKELEKELKQIISKNKGLPFNALIGKAMGKLRGKAAGQKIVELLKKLTS